MLENNSSITEKKSCLGDDIVTQLHHQNLDSGVSHRDIPLKDNLQLAEEELNEERDAAFPSLSVKLDFICYEQLLMALKFMLSIAYTAYSYRWAWCVVVCLV